MGVAGEAVEDPNAGDDGSAPSQEPVLEPDVPKPAFELPDKDEPTEADQQARGQPRRETARDRHRQRGEGYAQEASRLREELARQARDRQQLAEQVAELRGRMEERSKPADGEDPVRAKIKQGRAAVEQALQRMYSGDAAAVDEWHESMERIQTLIAEQAAEKAAAKNAPKPTDPVLDAVAARYDWLRTDDDARRVAEGHVARLVRKEGRDMSNPTVRKQTLMQAAAEAERDLGIGGSNGNDTPADVQRERFRGLGGQNTGASRGKTMVALNADQKAQAEALFRHLEPDAAHREWWKKIGASIADK